MTVPAAAPRISAASSSMARPIGSSLVVDDRKDSSNNKLMEFHAVISSSGKAKEVSVLGGTAADNNAPSALLRSLRSLRCPFCQPKQSFGAKRQRSLATKEQVKNIKLLFDES
jgi:hypothetical protein